MSDFLKPKFSELDHNDQILLITIYDEVMFQLYVVDLHQAKLKDKEAASSLKVFS